jgi:photosystem II stability/assembly factor-like uncharacterized protein
MAIRSSAIPFLALATPLAAADISADYHWQPVHLGAGGYVTGLVISPQDPDVRLCRTDVGNAYRWDTSAAEWIPLIVRRPDGTGMPASTALAPGGSGCSSIAIDPQHPTTFYLACPFHHSGDVAGQAKNLGINIYKSTDGGKNFTAANLDLAGDPNGAWRTNGERLQVDPQDPDIVYFGSEKDGLFRSTDGGATFARVTDGGAPAATANVINCWFAHPRESTLAFGQVVSADIFAVVADGGVFFSRDGGRTWTDLAAGTDLEHHVFSSAIDRNGTLWVCVHGSTTLWRWTDTWTTHDTPLRGQTTAVALDPNDPLVMYATGVDVGVACSRDGGDTWTDFGELRYANTLGWLPQKTGNTAWRSGGGIAVDRTSRVWIPQGNEGVVTWTPSPDHHETAENPPLWTIQSQGIEEFCTQEAIIPPGGNDRAVVTVQDGGGLVITDPDHFTAAQIPLQTGLLANGIGLAWTDDGHVLAISESDVHHIGDGANYAGRSIDIGQTWHAFPSRPYTLQAGSIALSSRAGIGLDGDDDHLVLLPSTNRPPWYSRDGGATWTASSSFPVDPAGFLTGGFQGFWIFALKQNMLQADPFVRDRFYLNLVQGGFFISTDGGATWTKQDHAGLPPYAHHGQLAVNQKTQGDLWFADGWEGAANHGLWHSTDGGATFAKIPGMSHAITLTLGAGSGKPGDAPATVYVYGLLDGDPRWGVFRSTTNGATWDRIAQYPCGILDQPTCLAASWDTFGLVYVGFAGQGLAYGKPLTAPGRAKNP